MLLAAGRPAWSRWLEFDPVRMAEAHADALCGMRRIYLDAGRQDEFFLDLGAQGLSRELARLGIDHTLELFDGKHDASTDRYADAIGELVCALSED
jgi:predicted esterase